MNPLKSIMIKKKIIVENKINNLLEEPIDIKIPHLSGKLI